MSNKNYSYRLLDVLAIDFKFFKIEFDSKEFNSEVIGCDSNLLNVGFEKMHPNLDSPETKGIFCWETRVLLIFLQFI